METFLSTAFRYLKGQSSLPSTLPTREAIDLAKKESRKVRLFCKALENFREMFYVELDENIASTAGMEDLKRPGSTSPVLGSTADTKTTGLTTDAEDKGTSCSTSTVTMTRVDQKSRKYVLTTGGDLFQSLYPAEKVSPTSPGSEASSSTLLDPSSRKVSPSDIEICAKGSPTAVKDFARSPSPSEGGHMLDPEALIEKRTKRELLKQLQKKTVAEEKASQEVVRLTAQIKTLSAELESAKVDAQTRDAQIDLAKTHANAMTLSNVVLKHAWQDLSNEPSRVNGARIQGTPPLRETTHNQQEEEAFEPETKVEDSEGETEGKADGFHEKFGVDSAVLSDIFNSGTPTVPEILENKDAEEEAHNEEPPNEHEFSSGADDIGLATLHDSQEQVPEADEGSNMDNETDAQDAEHGKNEDQEENDQPEGEQIGSKTLPTEETLDHVETDVECIFPNLKPKDAAISKRLAMADTIAADPEEATPDQDSMSESSGEDQMFEEDGNNPHSTVEDYITGTDCDETTAILEPITDDRLNNEHLQGVSVGHKGCITENYEISEAAGPATLWGILQSNQSEEEVEDEAVSGQEAAGVSEVEVPGPATLWGILRSDHESSGDEPNDDGCEEEVGLNGDEALDESKSNNSAGIQDQDDAKLVAPSIDGFSPDPDDDFNDLYDVSDNAEDIVEPSSTTISPAVEEETALSPHGSPDSEDVAVPATHAEVAVEEAVYEFGDSTDDIVEATSEPFGNLEFVEEDNHEAVNDPVEAANLEECVVSIVESTPVGAVDNGAEYADDAIVARVEKDTQEAIKTEVRGVPEQLGDRCEAEDVIVVARASPFQKAVAGGMEDSEGGEPSAETAVSGTETLEGLAVAGNMQPTCEDSTENDDHEIHIVAVGGTSTIAAEDGDVEREVVLARSLTTPSMSPSAPRAFSLPPPEIFELMYEVPKPKQMTKGQKRKLERKRAAARKVEEAVLRSLMEEEAAKTPEALARRQAEEDATLGEKRMKLQAARMLRQV